MPDFKGAAQAAFYQALSAASSVTDMGNVYQHVPENTEPEPGVGLFIVGDLSAEPVGGKDGGLDRVMVELITVIREPDQSALTVRQAAARDVLEGGDLPEQEGARMSRPVLESEDATLTEDGQTYIGTQRFSVVVQEMILGPEMIANGSFPAGDSSGWSDPDGAWLFGDGYVETASTVGPTLFYTTQAAFAQGGCYRFSVEVIALGEGGGGYLDVRMGGFAGGVALAPELGSLVVEIGPLGEVSSPTELRLAAPLIAGFRITDLSVREIS